ncbi:ComEC/Rec2 family competence protein [Streptomyces sp. ICC1]|uniref:ComEC/Rec2 family competence protein n=1 Tax=Streptomyces sp. ICC1 TaxID=2099583 RepID=UPI001EF98463|nr:ComEC/Rec2 family competence protein [Streptomyces sp. ICC1]
MADARPADPRPADLRLAGPAAVAWAAAAVALGAPAARSLSAAALGAFGAGLLVLAGRRRPEPSRKAVAAAAAALLCAAAAAGVAGLQRAEARAGPVEELAREHARVLVELTVGSDPRAARSGSGPPVAVLDAVVTRVTAPDGVRTRVETPVRVLAGHPGWTRLQPSTRVEAVVRLAPARGGERAIALLRPAGDTPPRVTGGPDTAQRIAGQLRAGLREVTDGLAPDARALLPGLVVGDTSRVEPDLYEAFRATDLLHLLAVSGSNLTVVLFLLIGSPARAQQAERGGLAPRLGLSLRATALGGAALTLAFVVVCRPEPSVLRAAACGAVTLLAIATGRRRSLIPALAAAVLLLVLYDPWLARSPGFLLSVLATGALLTLAPRWSAALRGRGVRPRPAEALAAAAAAQAVCAPVVAVLSARVSLVAVPCNLLAELAAGPATVLGFAALAAAPLYRPAAELLAWCAGVPAGWIAAVARGGARLPGAELGLALIHLSEPPCVGCVQERAAGVRVPHPERLAAVLHGALAAWDPSYDDPSCGSPSYGGEGDGPARVAVAGAAELLRTARAAALDAARRGGGLDSLSVSYSAVARDFVLLGPGTAHLQGDGQRHLLSCRAIADGTGTGGTGTGGSCTGGSGPGGPSVGYRKAGYRKAGDPGSRESGAWEPGRDALAVGRGAALAAVAKRGAEPVAERNATVVIAAGASGVFAHELLGHPLERDVMAGGLAGVSWREGERVCPVALDVTDDPGIPGAWGSYAYDDEGTAALPGHLVRGGTVAGFVEDAGRLRRQSFRHPPMCRMSNVCIGPGPDDPAALLASVARGYHVSRLGGGEVRADGTFSLGAVDVRRVRDGRPAEPVADAVLTGEVAAVLAGLRGIGSDFAMGSPASCAKYGQEVPVGDGGPTLLVTGVDLGPGVDPWPGPGPRPGPSG